MMTLNKRGTIQISKEHPCRATEKQHTNLLRLPRLIGMLVQPVALFLKNHTSNRKKEEWTEKCWVP